jgi:hypothetical protein
LRAKGIKGPDGGGGETRGEMLILKFEMTGAGGEGRRGKDGKDGGVVLVKGDGAIRPCSGGGRARGKGLDD